MIRAAPVTVHANTGTGTTNTNNTNNNTPLTAPRPPTSPHHRLSTTAAAAEPMETSLPRA